MNRTLSLPLLSAAMRVLSASPQQQSLDVVPSLVAALDAMNGGTGPANALLRTIAANLRRKEIGGTMRMSSFCLFTDT